MKNLVKTLSVLTIVALLVFPKRADAYLDPGTGSYVLQIVAAVFFGGAFVVKTFWGKIKSFFTKSRKDKKQSEKSSEKDK